MNDKAINSRAKLPMSKLPDNRKSKIEYWHQIPWKRAEKVVFSLQRRIYQASQRGDVKAIRRLQKLLLHSFFAKAIAVRRVTQDNQGKKTAGIDGIKSLTPNQRLELVYTLNPLTGKAKSVRRVWIPKPGKDEKRPLGIPTMEDRARQCLVKLALEPEWEARFEPNSYGFRPGRSCHDAIAAIFNALRYKTAYVLDADIAKCFDRINHQALLKKLDTFPAIRRQIKAWLKSGITDEKKLFPSDEGTPQGGVISPLLANIALHGLETTIKDWITNKKIFDSNGHSIRGKIRKEKSISIIRYADDFVIIHKDLEIIREATEITKTWLAQLGLELKSNKTRICHTLEKLENEKPGFNFLGFNVRQYKTGRHHANKTTTGERKPYTLHIKPSKEAYLRHYREISQVIDRLKASKQEVLIKKLNPIIKGWSNYYKYSVCSEIFSKIDYLIFWKLKKWADRRHPNKSWKFKRPKYWKTIENDNWVFSDGKNRLIKHKKNYDESKKNTRKKGRKTQGEIFKKVQDVRSPYDGDSVYWSSRLGKHPNMPTNKAKMLKWQDGKCPHCGLSFKHEDVMEIDHITPRKAGGGSSYKNLQLLHRHCHDEKTRDDLKLIAEYQNRKELEKQHNKSIKWFNDLFSQEKWKWINDTPVLTSIHDKNHVSEEPYEVKVSRTVLKTSRRGDSLA
ncbi:MAG: group II intron reverse transcriptase/maturase [Prochloraceae cyanobacterium]|nr:group II intron reverse transcriptase/maturase [Prochloraceae cyanobacterium]